MTKDNLNMELRSMVIAETLIIEKLTKDLLQIIFRIFDTNTKTLGNSSNAISLKTKVDFLYDLQDISKEEYTMFLKIMEIRNQFAHNADATSFLALDLFNPDLNSYLKKVNMELFRELDCNEVEQKLMQSFISLTKKCKNKLNMLIVEYNAGLHKEIKDHFSLKAIEDVMSILKTMFIGLGENNMDTKALEEFGNRFASSLKIALMKDSQLKSSISAGIINKVTRKR